MPDDLPLVTILTASLNNLEGLKKTAESVAAQTFRDYEHIVVDGGSSDDTAEWLEANPYGITWLSESDRGIADALNKGLHLTRGRWVLVLHADDTFVDSESLEKAAAHLAGSERIVSNDVLFVTDRGERYWRSKGWTWKSNFKTTIPHHGALVHRSVFDEIGAFDPGLRIALDFDFFMRARRSGFGVVLTGSPLARMPDTGISSRRDWQSLRQRFAEERQVHLATRPNGWWRLVYLLYWPLYLTYRSLRRALGQ